MKDFDLRRVSKMQLLSDNQALARQVFDLERQMFCFKTKTFRFFSFEEMQAGLKKLERRGWQVFVENNTREFFADYFVVARKLSLEKDLSKPRMFDRGENMAEKKKKEAKK